MNYSIVDLLSRLDQNRRLWSDAGVTARRRLLRHDGAQESSFSLVRTGVAPFAAVQPRVRHLDVRSYRLGNVYFWRGPLDGSDRVGNLEEDR